jgi:hypothetical protein
MVRNNKILKCIDFTIFKTKAVLNRTKEVVHNTCEVPKQIIVYNNMGRTIVRESDYGNGNVVENHEYMNATILFDGVTLGSLSFVATKSFVAGGVGFIVGIGYGSYATNWLSKRNRKF